MFFHIIIKKIKVPALCAAVLATAMAATACGLGQAQLYRTTGFAMDTVIDQMVYSTSSTKAQAAENKVTQEINKLDKTLTAIGTGTDVININKNAGKGSVKIGDDTLSVLQTALKMAKFTGGAFDFTVGPLVNAWGIGSDKPQVLTQSQIDKLLPLVGYQTVRVDAANHTAALPKAGQAIDLGSIGIGYAGTMAQKVYQENGITSACINLGGNVVTVGKRSDGSLWTIGVQNPRAATGQYIGTLKVSDMAVVTAGDDQKYFIQNGVRYCHIIDPRTGKPAQSGLMSTTIVTKSSTEADPLSTSTFVLGLEKGMQLVKQYGAEAIFITTDKKVYVTPGLKNSFTFDDSSGEYSYVQEG